MKKSLLFASALAVAFGANAQIEVGFTNSEALDLASKPVMPQGTELASSKSVKMSFWGADQEVSAQNPDFNGFKKIVVNGEVIDIVQGIGGSTNGSLSDISVGPAEGGCMYRFEVAQDGWLVVVSKISSNKNFYVYEGLPGNDPQPVAYTLGMDISNADYAKGEIKVTRNEVEETITLDAPVTQVNYTLPADDMGYIDLAASDIEKYTFGATTIAWPIRIATGISDAPTAGNGTGALVFPVYAEAVDYICLATGSKMNTCGFVFVPGKDMPSVSIVAPEREVEGETIPEVTKVICEGAGSASIDNIASDVKAAELDWNAPVYNVMGQKVSKNFKGIAIQNGAKFVVK